MTDYEMKQRHEALVQELANQLGDNMFKRFEELSPAEREVVTEHYKKQDALVLECQAARDARNAN